MPAEVLVEADDVVLVVTREEGVAEAGVEHIDESLDREEEWEVVRFELVKGVWETGGRVF